MYWVVVPEEVTEMHLNDVVSGLHRAGDDCYGHVKQSDEAKHTVSVTCNLVPGETYNFYLALESDDNQVERGIPLTIPARAPRPPPFKRLQAQAQGSNQQTEEPRQAPKATVFQSTQPALNQFGSHPNHYHAANGMTSTRSALGVWTGKPTRKPSEKPTLMPTLRPTTKIPTGKPTLQPTRKPTLKPTHKPSVKPTLKPTNKPTFKPSYKPTLIPSGNPTQTPTGVPTEWPSFNPSLSPTLTPTFVPSLKPSLKPSFGPTFVPTVKPTTTLGPTNFPTKKPVTTLAPSIAPFGLEIGDKVNANGQAGCVVGLRPQFSIALEDEKKGTYLYHMDVAPPLMQRSGCLLDAMDDNATTEKPTLQPTTTTQKPTEPPTIEQTVPDLTIEPIAPDQPTVTPTTTTAIPTTTTQAEVIITQHLTQEPIVHQGPTEPIQQIIDVHITDEPIEKPTEPEKKEEKNDYLQEFNEANQKPNLDIETQPPSSGSDDDDFHDELHFEAEPFKLAEESQEESVSVVGVWEPTTPVYSLGALLGVCGMVMLYRRWKNTGDHYEHNIHLLVDAELEEEF